MRELQRGPGSRPPDSQSSPLTTLATTVTSFSVSVSVLHQTNPAASRLHRRLDPVPTPDAQNAPTRLALWIFGSIGVALVVAALTAGLWYFLRGRQGKRTPETPQNTTTLQKPGWPISLRLLPVAGPFSPLTSRSSPRVRHSPCRVRRAPRSDHRLRLPLQARRCLLSNIVWTPKHPPGG